MVGISSSSSAKQSQTQSWIPNYEPQLDFLRRFGNDAAGLANAQWQWAQTQFGRNSALTGANINHGFVPGAQAQMDAAMQDLGSYDAYYPQQLGRLDAQRQYYNSQAGQANEMKQAEGQTAQDFTSQRANLEAQLGSYGVDVSPSNNKFAQQLKSIETQEGAALAASGNQAFSGAQATGRALTQEELQALQRLPAQASTDTNVGFSGLMGGQNAVFGNSSLGALTLGTPQGYLQSGTQDVKFQPLGQTTQSQGTSGSSDFSDSGGGGDLSLSNDNSGMFMLERGGAIPQFAGGGPNILINDPFSGDAPAGPYPPSDQHYDPMEHQGDQSYAHLADYYNNLPGATQYQQPPAFEPVDIHNTGYTGDYYTPFPTDHMPSGDVGMGGDTGGGDHGGGGGDGGGGTGDDDCGGCPPGHHCGYLGISSSHPVCIPDTNGHQTFVFARGGAIPDRGY